VGTITEPQHDGIGPVAGNTSTATAAAASGPRGGSGEMFDLIAHRYDLLNRLISLGIDQRWRRRTVAALELRPDQSVLDLATGTADLALQIVEREPSTQVVGVDPSPRMLAVAAQKIHAVAPAARIVLCTGDAQRLDFPDDSFDGITMGFGIRNVPDKPRALREMARVTRPKGRVAILELSQPRRGLLGPVARFHVHTVVPWFGAVLSGAREYRYLARSIAAFPHPDEFRALMTAAGLRVLRVDRLAFGAAHLYVAEPGEEA